MTEPIKQLYEAYGTNQILRRGLKKLVAPQGKKFENDFLYIRYYFFIEKGGAVKNSFFYSSFEGIGKNGPERTN